VRRRLARLDLTGRIGLGIVALVLTVALLGPLFAPHSTINPIGVPGAGPSASAPFGTDFLGRDVLSRLLHGGWSVILLGFAATALAYLAGGLVGLVAGYSRSLVDPLLMRAVDVLLAFPALLLLLVLVTGAGSSESVLILGVALVQMPGISRIVRTATLEVSVRGYVEAAMIRGERTPAVLRREVLPNILGPVIATAGLRFTLSVVLIASVNFLGLGLQPPASDWGLMVSENREILNLNPLSVLMPALMLALLTIGITMVGDSYARRLGSSRVMRVAGT
jgi:peptide/nickel transport system permease protein